MILLIIIVFIIIPLCSVCKYYKHKAWKEEMEKNPLLPCHPDDWNC